MDIGPRKKKLLQKWNMHMNNELENEKEMTLRELLCT